MIGRKRGHPPFTMGDMTLAAVRSTRDLGVIIQDDLKTREQPTLARHKGLTLLWIFKRAFTSCSMQIFPLNLFTYEFRRSRGDQIMIYKVIVCGDIPEVAQYFKPAVARCEYMEQNPPPDIVAADMVVGFKKKYDAFYE
ncbi:unnamed protein product [Dibothriocephalus latus]|uniref:Uncharacterized protein n=1 Tax=Dibothriocephalus latus TaxID=60516 RepID=A0A3P7NM07_DIBLA|nr:unnamed protein product [Dibothriocephalus latus]